VHVFHLFNNGKHYSHVHRLTHSESFPVCTCAVSETYWKRSKQSATVWEFINSNNTHIYTHTLGLQLRNRRGEKHLSGRAKSLFPFFCSFFLLCLICPFLTLSFSPSVCCSLSQTENKERRKRRMSKGLRERRKESEVLKLK